ncbi:MAG TPA: hypothetical protein PKL31_09890 [Fulvivirga sp.]|nr:hypothetical protein [Fulvivirga sp.]
MKYFLFIVVFFVSFGSRAQVNQTDIYELEKKNSDDYFTVLPADEAGVIIFRDTDNYKKGDLWQVVSLDTALNERWNNELTIDGKYKFKGYDLKNSELYLLFRDGELEKSDYHLMAINILDGDVTRYDIKNEIALELSHITMLSDRMILAGYVNLSPTLVDYKLGSDQFEVVPGFFKDRSNVVDLRGNNNGTFNVVTLEKDYEGTFLRLRTYSDEGDILFEREVQTADDYKLLSAKSSGFIDGNIAISGTFGLRNSKYAVGIYLAIVKPEGQKNLVKYFRFSDFEHFFDYMRPKRAARLRAKLARRTAKGKDFHYSSRLLLHEIRKSPRGFVLAAEIYDPDFKGYYGPGYYYGYIGQDQIERDNRAAQSYAKHPSTLQNVDDADHFEYLESIIFELDKNGELLWDNSFKIEDVETNTLEQVVQFSMEGDLINMIYKTDEELRFKTIQESQLVEEKNLPIKLINEYDKIIHTYKGTGKSEYWYGNNFLIWGYHKVENKVETEKRNRSVLFVNKVVFD